MGADRTLSPKSWKKLADPRYMVVDGVTLMVVLGVTLLFLANTGAGGDGGAGPDSQGWWIGYPDHHSRAGSPVDHPSWALEPLEEKPVLILVHTANCPACKRQEAGVKKVLRDLGDGVVYVDVMADSDHQKAWDGLVIYDPTGNPRLVPLTVYLTLVPGPEGAQVAWQSAVGYQGEGWIRSRLDDAIRLHARGSGGSDP